MVRRGTPIEVYFRPRKEGRAAADRAKRIEGSLQTALEKDLSEYVDRQMENARRAIFLVELSREIREHGAKEPSQEEDLLRAAVVLTHACLEDFLRVVARAVLPDEDKSSARQGPTTWAASRRDKFTSPRSTFCSKGRIKELLKELGFALPGNGDDLAAVGGMIERRHLIVHQADRVKLPDSDIYALQPIESADVEKWVLATHRFMTRLMKAKFLKTLPLLVEGIERNLM